MKSFKSNKTLRRAAAFTAAFLSFTAFDTTRVSAEVVRNDNSEDLRRSGIPLYEWKDTAIKEPKCIVVAIHGAAQQGGVLDTLGRSLASLGYLVLAPDLRGAGRWNMMAPSTSNGTFSEFVQSCDDLERLLKLLRKEHPKSSFFCIGESAGSTVVLSAMVKDATRCKGIILCSAGSEPKLHAPGSMGPEFYKNLMHVTTPVDMSEFMGRYSSDDKRISDEMIHDPLGRNKLSALELLGTFNFIQQGNVFAAQIPRTLPALLIQGQQDQIINANSSVKLLGKLASTDKNLMMLPASGHILIGTTYVKPEVEDAIIGWLAAHGGLKAGMVSHAMPPSAPNLQSFSHMPIENDGALRGGGQNLVNPEEWREQQAAHAAERAAHSKAQPWEQSQGQASLPPTPFSSMQSPLSPRLSEPSQPSTLSRAPSTISPAAPVEEASSSRSESAAMQTTTPDTKASSLPLEKPETPPPSLSDLLQALGGSGSEVQSVKSNSEPPAENKAPDKATPGKEEMPSLRENIQP
jgi:alpha-beta hydrolase superfamily lysophospholipase